VPLPRGLSAKAPFFDRRLLVLATGMFAIGTDSFVVAGILIQIAQGLGISIAAAGQLITVYAVSYAVFTPIMAAALSHWPRKRVLLTGLVIFLAGNLVAAFGPSFVVVLLGRALSGLGAAIFAPMASATAAAIATPGQRGRALAVMMAGLSIATAFGAPLGTLIGALVDWRMTFVLVAALAALVAGGIQLLVHDATPSTWLPWRQRLGPLRDPRVILTLLATFLVLTGLYVTYTYIGVVFDRATRGNGVILAVLLSVWGIAGTAGIIIAGRLTDRLGDRIVINAALAVSACDFALLPWTGANLGSAVLALVIWGLCGWGVIIPQQHRLVGLAPQLAPILLGLYAMAVYAGTSVAGVIGAVALGVVGAHQLPLVGTFLIICGLIAAEAASRAIKAVSTRTDEILS
jgi:predicted MFS family arabinose efflux permease